MSNQREGDCACIMGQYTVCSCLLSLVISRDVKSMDIITNSGASIYEKARLQNMHTCMRSMNIILPNKLKNKHYLPDTTEEQAFWSG